MGQRTAHQHRNHVQRGKLARRHHSSAAYTEKVLFQSVTEVWKEGKRMFQKAIARRTQNRGA